MWSACTLGQLCDRGTALIQTGPFGSQLHAHDYTPSGVRVIATEGIGRRRIVDEGLPRVPPAVVYRLSRHILQEGDILFARRGLQATGLSALVDKKFVGSICGTGAILLRLFDNALDPTFLSFFLSGSNTITWLKSQAVGAVMPNLNETILRRLEIPLPPVPEQRAIAAVLGALDDKIDLNRQMNETLEETARALFKSWFVDFDPVRAKAEGRQPFGMDTATAAMFPDSFEDSDLREVPRAWKVETLAAALRGGGGEIQTGPFGSQLHASDYELVGTPVVMPTNIANRRIDDSSIARVNEGHVKRLHIHRLRVGDIVYSRRGDVEKHALVGRAEAGWLCGTGCLRVRPGNTLNPHFLSLWLDLASSRTWIAARAVGATMPNLNTTILGEVPLLAVPASVQLSFAQIVEAIDLRVQLARAENSSLAELRDYLLPKLLSGEIRVRDAEKLLEATP
jgi:type I restriction enzyme, S subunit